MTTQERWSDKPITQGFVVKLIAVALGAVVLLTALALVLATWSA